MAARLSWTSPTLPAFFALLALAPTLHGAAVKMDSKARVAQDMAPAVRIPVEPLGFSAPSRFYLTARFSSLTLDFIDADHLLFTFRKGGLLQREPNDPNDDMDQIIHALVLEASTGKVVNETVWRMHDREAYLWALGDGKFLVRQRNQLYRTDEKLQLRPFLHTDSEIQAISVSPTHRLMAVEYAKYEQEPQTEKAPEADAAKPMQAPTLGPDAPHLDAELPQTERHKSTDILIVKLPEAQAIARTHTRAPVNLPMLADGLVIAVEGTKPDQWVVQTSPFHGESAKIGEMQSACAPTLTALSETETMVTGCPGGGSDHSVTVFSTMGGVLWQDRWQPRYIWPTFAFAENGTRFAYGSLEINHAVSTLDPVGEDDVIGQPVGVFDTQTGKLELVKAASPEISAGHNYALSADGREFAILREGAIEIYHLPPAPGTPPQLTPPAQAHR
ncbi:hypothetical protein [Silvibacterium sp.]|uniref:hypothetical protein n=1 Tax=Silvibacterium sp. TaxID=1964179 RepID=UPI0039E4C1B0